MLSVDDVRKKIKTLKKDISKFENSEIDCHKEYVNHMRSLLGVYEHVLYASNNYIPDEEYNGLDKYNWLRANKKNGEFI